MTSRDDPRQLEPRATARAVIEHVDETMVSIPGGSIALHDARTDTRWTVALEPFRLACYPTTKGLYGSVLRDATAHGGRQREPVTDVAWQDAIRFCNRLSQMADRTPCYTIAEDSDTVQCDWAADGYRLPSEAEWEHACRAGTTSARYGELDEIAWHAKNSGFRIHEVGTREPNLWGLHDMLGNVWEWCWDVLDANVYGEYRVFRGGGWADREWSCRASCRRGSHPSFRIDDLGFRIARRCSA